MRLTIRTLLGYMDDILDPQDAEEIGHRIEESEVASTLFHRIRDVTRRLSLKAPDLDEGDGIDPNPVAEYLDNVLPDDRVPDFEKVCLDSDMHLAEVAACHQVLAVALGEAAEIDPSSREHMYQLPQVAADMENMERRPNDPLGDPLNRAIGENGESITRVPKRPSPIVPDYLREKARRKPIVPIIMGAAVSVCIVIIVLVLSGVFGPLGTKPSEEVAQSNGKTPVVQAPVVQAPVVQAPVVPEGGATTEKTTVPGDVTPAGTAPTEGTTPGTAEALPAAGNLPISTPENGTAPNIPGVIGSLPSTPSPTAGGLAPNPVPANPTNPTDPAGEDAPPETDPAVPEGAAIPEAPALVGRFVSESQALVQLDPADVAWNVVPQQSVLTAPTPLVALSTYRPIIATASGLSVQLLSETQVTMQPTKMDAMPVLKLQYGRIVLRSLGKPNLRLLLTAGKKTSIVTLVNPNSAAAVELTFHRKPGFDPTKIPSTVDVHLFTISGTVLWEEDDKSDSLKVDASEYVTFFSDEAPPKIEVLGEIPEWINVPPISKLDQNASEEIFKALGTNRLASLALRELLDHRQREVSRLALKSLTQLGQLEAAVASLNNRSKKLTWDQTITQLFDMASQSTEMAEQVHQAFEREYGEVAPDLWRMLWGYTAEQLKNDGAIQLIEHLDHDRLVFRVMSFYNLKEITGKSLYYKPEETPARRKTPTQRWRSELQKGKIVPAKK